MAFRKHQGRSGNASLFTSSLLLCGFILHKVPSFVGSSNPQPRLHGVERHAGDDEVAALLAQAKALRDEAERDEAAMNAQRSAQEAAEAAEAVEAAAAAADAVALQEAAERARKAAEAAGENDPVAKARAELAAAKANLEMAKQEAAGIGKTAASSTPKAEGTPSSNPSGRLEDVQMNYSGTVMTQAEWEDLSEKFKDMNLIEQFQTNSKVGPQGRRKLKALREGQTGRAFILPGERVRLLKEDKAFRAAFKRFPDGSLNGYTAEKWAKRGQECIIEKTFNDKTITCVFADGSRSDFPWEIVDGYVDD